MALRIEDYALIGDCETAALVGNDGSIDWLCFPRFDSGACFASLLGTPENGRWQIAPAVDGTMRSPQAVRRHYRQGTLILETDFETDEGAVTLIDFMPPRKHGAATVARIVVGKRGRVKMRMELVIRFDYGSVVPWVRKLPDRHGIRATAGPDTLYLISLVPLQGHDLHTLAEFTVSEGDRIPFTLTWHPTYRHEPVEPDAEAALGKCEAWWRNWSSRCTDQGEWHEAVVRSLITLKALTYAPTGGMVAAATTSLPEELGGVRNWDYRYCWIRDASFTLRAFMNGGYIDEARAWRRWLVDAVAGKPAELQIMYGLAGERRLTELELPWLEGYEKSKPVRIGNGAYNQRQLDVYGEIMGSLYLAHKLGLPPRAHAWRIQRAILDFLETAWREPDEGIWEVRGPRRHFTHSKVMAWVAFDRAVKTIEEFGQHGDAERWRHARDEVRAQVLAQGFNTSVNAFTQYYGSTDPDASLLVLPLVGFIPATDPKMIGTVKLVRTRLAHDGFVSRYPTVSGVDGLAGGEGAFLICTYWLADNLALQGDVAGAREIFERLLALRNDVGLLSEEYDTHGKRFLGNFPQAFSHVGLINTAKRLTEAERESSERTAKST